MPVLTREVPAPDALEDITDAMPHMVWVADAAGATTHHNRRILDYAGLPAGTTLGAGWVCGGGFLIGPGVNLAWSNIAGLNLTGVSLAGANLTGAALTNDNLTSADLSQATLTNVTSSGLTGDR